MMDEKDLWPINKEVWNYLDGNGFHLMTTMYTDLVNNYGKSSTIDEFAQKGQLVGAMNSKSIWEVWNYNKLDYGDRFCSGLLFWYHNCSMRQVSSVVFLQLEQLLVLQLILKQVVEPLLLVSSMRYSY